MEQVVVRFVHEMSCRQLLVKAVVMVSEDFCTMSRCRAVLCDYELNRLLA